MDDKDIKKIVKEGYAKIVKNETTCCNPIDVCCGSSTHPNEISKNIGYSNELMLQTDVIINQAVLLQH